MLSRHDKGKVIISAPHIVMVIAMLSGPASVLRRCKVLHTGVHLCNPMLHPPIPSDGLELDEDHEDFIIHFSDRDTVGA